MKVPRELAAEANEDMLFLHEERWDKALVGYVRRFGQPPVALYDQEKIIEILMEDGCTYEEAVEFFEFNQIGAWMGENTPAFAVILNGPQRD